MLKARYHKLRGHNMSQTLAELFNVDTKEEDAILEGNLPDVPVVKQLEDGIVVIGVSGKNAAHKACTMRRGLYSFGGG